MCQIRRLGRLFDMASLRLHHVSGLFLMAFLPQNFQGNKSTKIIHLQHFCCFRKLSRPNTLNFDKIVEYWYIWKFRRTGFNIGKMWQMAAFLKRSKLRHSCGNPAAICQGALLISCYILSFWDKIRINMKINSERGNHFCVTADFTLLLILSELWSKAWNKEVDTSYTSWQGRPLSQGQGF